MSEFHFHPISWEQIDVFWSDFEDALILIKSWKGPLRIIFLLIFDRIMALDWNKIFVCVQYFGKESIEYLIKICNCIDTDKM